MLEKIIFEYFSRGSKANPSSPCAALYMHTGQGNLYSKDTVGTIRIAIMAWYWSGGDYGGDGVNKKIGREESFVFGDI